MNPLQQLLKDSDPVAQEPPLPEDSIQHMRRAVIAAVDDRESPFIPWCRLVLTAATLAVVLGAVTRIARTGMPQWLAPSAPADLEAIGEPATRQLQFSTPGGTRVIWVFNPEFEQ